MQNAGIGPGVPGERGVAVQLDMFGTTYLNAAGNLDAAAERYQQAFQAGQYGYGSAVAVVMLVILIPVIIFNVRRFRAKAVM